MNSQSGVRVWVRFRHLKPNTAAPAPTTQHLHLKPHTAAPAPRTPHSCTSEQSSMCSYKNTDTADYELLQPYLRTLQLHLRALYLQFKSLSPSANLAVHTAFLFSQIEFKFLQINRTFLSSSSKFKIFTQENFSKNFHCAD